MVRAVPPRTVHALIARIASIGASFLLTVVVARVLPPAGAGVFFVVFTSVTVVATFARFGVDTLAVKLLSGSGDHHSTMRAAWLVVLLASAVGAVVVMGGVIVSSGGGMGWIGVVGVAAAVPGLALSVVAGAVLRSTHRMVAGILAELGFVPAMSTILLAAAWLAGSASVELAIGAFALSSIFAAAWSVPLAVRSSRVHDSGRPREDPVTFGRFLRENVRPLSAMMLSALLVYVAAWAPVFVLSSLGLLQQVTLFTIAARVANFLTLVPSVQVSYLAPRFARDFFAGRIGDLNRLARSSALQAVGLVAIPAAVLLIAAEPVVRLLFGADLAGAAVPLRFLIVGAVASVAAGQVNQLMLLCELEGTSFILNATVIVPWLAAGVWIASGWGAAGTAALSMLLTVAYSVAASVVLRRSRGIRAGVV
ncbi:hypothetical protein AAIB33_01940 [Microbacterium sp. AZCO]|uniref:hypothetical protein n=1 Tax=Microbacterium sp. AZCO TaxID=3142976 RepID=UPI0031F36D7D